LVVYNILLAFYADTLTPSIGGECDDQGWNWPTSLDLAGQMVVEIRVKPHESIMRFPEPPGYS
jgi:hypothetical protein